MKKLMILLFLDISARARRLPFMHIKRKRRLRLSWFPEPKPTCSFILHSQMPHRKKMGELPNIDTLNTEQVFAVVKTSIGKQHKVWDGSFWDRTGAVGRRRELNISIRWLEVIWFWPEELVENRQVRFGSFYYFVDSEKTGVLSKGAGAQ